MIRLINDDCLVAMDKLIEESITVDAIICDLPYGLTACKWDSVIPFDEMWERLNKLIKPNGAIVLFASQPFSSLLVSSNIKNFKYEWVWNKKQGGHPLNAKKQPLKIHEQILVFNKHNYYPVMRKGKLRKKGGLNKQPLHTGKVNIEYSTVNDEYYPTSIIEFSNANKKNKVHPTQKPVALMEYLIKTYTNENELVLDFTCGSGSTLVGCINTNRRGIGIEMDKNYFQIASDRINNNKNLGLFSEL